MKARLMLALWSVPFCASFATAQTLVTNPYSMRNAVITSAEIPWELEEVRTFPIYRAVAPTKVSNPPSKESLPSDARDMLDKFEAKAKAIRTAANQDICRLRPPIVRELKALQDKYTRAGKLDEAVAIRDWIRTLKEPLEPVQSDPGALYRYSSQVGKSFFFRVAGAVGGSLWGTDVYTGDSNLAAAALHAGVLKAGESGVVKVTILPGRTSYEGSTRNGVSSASYGSYPTSFKVESAAGEDCSYLGDDDQPPKRSEKARKTAGRTKRSAKDGK
jgi:hypothetical protein